MNNDTLTKHDATILKIKDELGIRGDFSFYSEVICIEDHIHYDDYFRPIEGAEQRFEFFVCLFKSETLLELYLEDEEYWGVEGN